MRPSVRSHSTASVRPMCASESGWASSGWGSSASSLRACFEPPAAMSSASTSISWRWSSRGVQARSRIRATTPAYRRRVRAHTGGLGLDAVLLCASSASPDPLELAVELARDRGRIVVVGETTIAVDRAPMYEKELELRMSRSYGPGRYDRDYEERGRDLPAGYVRWTEQRNMQAFLDLVASGRLAPRELTTHSFPVDAAATPIGSSPSPASERPFGVLLEYTAEPEALRARAPRAAAPTASRAIPASR